MSFDPANLDNPDASKLSSQDMQVLEDWDNKFAKKYPVVGKIVTETGANTERSAGVDADADTDADADGAPEETPGSGAQANAQLRKDDAADAEGTAATDNVRGMTNAGVCGQTGPDGEADAVVVTESADNTAGAVDGEAVKDETEVEDAAVDHVDAVAHANDKGVEKELGAETEACPDPKSDGESVKIPDNGGAGLDDKESNSKDAAVDEVADAVASKCPEEETAVECMTDAVDDAVVDDKSGADSAASIVPSLNNNANAAEEIAKDPTVDVNEKTVIDNEIATEITADVGDEDAMVEEERSTANVTGNDDMVIVHVGEGSKDENAHEGVIDKPSPRSDEDVGADVGVDATASPAATPPVVPDVASPDADTNADKYETVDENPSADDTIGAEKGAAVTGVGNVDTPQHGEITTVDMSDIRSPDEDGGVKEKPCADDAVDTETEAAKADEGAAIIPEDGGERRFDRCRHSGWERGGGREAMCGGHSRR